MIVVSMWMTKSFEDIWRKDDRFYEKIMSLDVGMTRRQSMCARDIQFSIDGKLVYNKNLELDET